MALLQDNCEQLCKDLGRMISFEESRKLILDAVEPLGSEVLALDQLVGAVTAEPALASEDMPAFDNSAVDGFGVIVSDIAGSTQRSLGELDLVGEVRAGDAGDIAIESGQTVRILTGAVVPRGVEAVVMKEFCSERNGRVAFSVSALKGDNIRRRGEEYHEGDTVLPAGALVTPPVVGLIASAGLDRLSVYRRPSVAVVVTGDELVEPGQPLKKGQIYDSNSYALSAAVRAMGISECSVLRVRDERIATRDTFSRAIAISDVVISTGGVSVGDYDFVKDVAEDLGVSTIFWRIAIKPGKPVYFGVASRDDGRKIYVFGLPGNPVSGLVTFHQLVRPALLSLMGTGVDETRKLMARMGRDMRKKRGRLEFVRGRLKVRGEEIFAFPCSGQGSHMLGGLVEADCLICFPCEADRLAEEEPVEVERLCWWQ